MDLIYDTFSIASSISWAVKTSINNDSSTSPPGHSSIYYSLWASYQTKSLYQICMNLIGAPWYPAPEGGSTLLLPPWLRPKRPQALNCDLLYSIWASFNKKLPGLHESDGGVERGFMTPQFLPIHSIVTPQPPPPTF